MFNQTCAAPWFPTSWLIPDRLLCLVVIEHYCDYGELLIVRRSALPADILPADLFFHLFFLVCVTDGWKPNKSATPTMAKTVSDQPHVIYMWPPKTRPPCMPTNPTATPKRQHERCLGTVQNSRYHWHGSFKPNQNIVLHPRWRTC